MVQLGNHLNCSQTYAKKAFLLTSGHNHIITLTVIVVAVLTLTEETNSLSLISIFRSVGNWLVQQVLEGNAQGNC